MFRPGNGGFAPALAGDSALHPHSGSVASDAEGCPEFSKGPRFFVLFCVFLRGGVFFCLFVF